MFTGPEVVKFNEKNVHALFLDYEKVFKPIFIRIIMKSIALGMDPNERYIVQDRMSTKMALRITEKCRDSEAVPFATAGDLCDSGLLDVLRQNGGRQVQILGAYENMCVASAVIHAVSIGLSVSVPKKFVVKPHRSAQGLIASMDEINSIRLDSVPFKYSQDPERYFIRPSSALQESYLFESS